jgi:beta-xylosidase
MATLTSGCRLAGRSKRLLLLALAVASACSGLRAAQSADPDPKTSLLFSFFREPNGQAGFFLATSEDGLKWTEIAPPNGRSFLEPKVGGKLMRDPSLALGPDGTFHMVWTTSWGRPPVFGHASSKDLVTWSEQQAVPVMENDPQCENVWAPELFYDEKKAEWLVFWASTIPGKFIETKDSGDHNHRIYSVATKDFKTFGPTKLFYDGGFNVIDATLLPAKGRFYLVVKDETKNPVKKELRLAVADSPTGPFGPAGAPISTNWVEGPSAIQIGEDYFIYFDHYTNPRYYGAIKSRDLVSWEDISKQISFPRGIRHGTALRVPEAIVRNLQALQTRTTNQP